MPDYIFMLQSRLSSEQWQLLNRLQDAAQTIPLNLYLVGGAVRDLMTGSSIRDLDFAVEGNARKLVDTFDEPELSYLRWDESRRSAELALPSGLYFSIEMARSEMYTRPGGPPEVRPAPILEDLRRRDFSINAIGLSLNPGSRGLLLDPTNGLADIENRSLRVLHNYSFMHDPSRILRLVRLRTRLNFTIEPRTQELLEVALEKKYPELTAPAAVGREMEQLTREENPAAVLKAWQRQGLLTVFHPRLQRRSPDYDGLAKLQRYRASAVAAGYFFDSYAQVLYYVLRKLKGREQHTLLRNIGLGGREAEKVRGLEQEARKVVKLLARRRRAGPRQVYELLAPVRTELLVFILALFSNRRNIQAKVHNHLFRYLPLRRQLPVRELELLGVPRGTQFDQMLERFFQARLEGRLRSRPEQLRFLRKLAGVAKPAKKAAKGRAATRAGQPAKVAVPKKLAPKAHRRR